MFWKIRHTKLWDKNESPNPNKNTKPGKKKINLSVEDFIILADHKSDIKGI